MNGAFVSRIWSSLRIGRAFVAGLWCNRPSNAAPELWHLCVHVQFFFPCIVMPDLSLLCSHVLPLSLIPLYVYILCEFPPYPLLGCLFFTPCVSQVPCSLMFSQFRLVIAFWFSLICTSKFCPISSSPFVTPVPIFLCCLCLGPLSAS